MGLMYVNRANSGCDYHRISLPLQYLPNIKRSYDYRSASVVFYNRMPLEPLSYFLSAKKRYGFKTIVDIDDYWHLYTDHYLYNHWKESDAANKIKESIYNADAVICTNDLLAEKIRAINTNVYIVPNALPFDEGQFRRTAPHKGIPRILFAGGCSHYHDLEMVADKITETCNFKNVEFRLAGFNPNEPEWIRIKDLFKGIKPHLFSIAHIQPIDRYMDVYNGSSFVIAPLVDNKFNNCKSNLKILEAGAKGLPILCSGTDNYIKDQRQISPSYGFDTGVMFIGKIKNMFDEIEWTEPNNLTGDKGDAIASYVRRHYHLKEINKLRENIFNQFIL